MIVTEEIAKIFADDPKEDIGLEAPVDPSMDLVDGLVCPSCGATSCERRLEEDLCLAECPECGAAFTASRDTQAHKIIKQLHRR